MTAKKRIVVLATGGTIAGVGEEGKSTGYQSGQLSVEDLLAAAPQIDRVAELESHQVCNVNSDDISAPVWIDLARAIQEHADRPEVDGFVVTHGTDTMEETAFFLNLVLKTDKPVIVTGSMRPATATSADGPMNLYQSVVCAACPESKGRGVQVVFSGRIFSARDVQKTSANAMEAMSGLESGSRGLICDDMVLYTSAGVRPHTVDSEFSIEGLTDLPKVNVLYFAVDSDPALVKMAASVSDGLVVAGAGAGEFSLAFARELDELDIPVAISSRIANGIVPPAFHLCEKGIPASDLPPHKAAILLRLALTRTSDAAEIRRIMNTY